MISKSVSKFNKQALTLAMSLAFGLAGCSSGSSGGGGTPAATSQSVSGGGVKGPLANAVVTVYSFDASQSDFRSTSSVAAGTTDSSAAITGLALPFPLDPPYIMEFTSVSGTTDITTGQAPVITTMSTVITQSSLDSGEQIYATPLTTMAVDIAVANAADANGTAGIQVDEFETALTVAASQVVSTLGFGLDSSVDIFDTPPLVDDTTDTMEEQTNVAAYRAAVEAVTAVAYQIDQQTAGGDTNSVLAELAADLADGGGIDGSAGTEINTNTLQVLEQDPATLPIPNEPSNRTVGQIQEILVAETATTGATTDTTDLDAGGSIATVPAPAETNPDLDSDGVLNADDAYPNDVTADTDTDGDGAPDVAYTDANRTTVDTARSDTDDDNDGWADGANVDDYPLDATRYINPDLNRDGDSILNGADNCPVTTNEDQADTDADGTGDACSNDNDGDGIDDGADNCPVNANPGQDDLNTDGEGDVCDTDIDGDTVVNTTDLFPLDATETIDTDGDGIGNAADTDDDNDGVADGSDTGVNPTDGTTLCSVLRDCDGDGVYDGSDFNPVDAAVTFNFAPVANNDTATDVEDASTITISVTANDTDNDGNPADAVSLTAIGSNDTAIGSAIINGNNIDYTPVADASGVDTFTYTVTDGTVTSTGSVTVTITAVNDAPTFTSTEVTAANEDATYSYTAAANDVDTADTLTLSAPTLPAWLTFDAATGVLTGTPNNSHVGVHPIVIRVNDGTVDVNQSFNITVANTPDAPAFTSTFVTSVNEDSAYSYTATAADVDAGASLTLTAPTLPTWLTFTPGTGVLAGTPNNSHVGVHNVTLRVDDGITAPVDQSFTVTVVNINDAPTFTTTAVTAVNEDSAYSYDANVDDVDPAPDTLTLSTLGLPSWLSFDAATGILSGTPLNAHVGIHNITIRVNDGTVDVDQTFNITVANTNDVPVLVGDSATVGANTVTQINVLSNDSDEDVGDALTITGVSNGTKGTVANNGTSVTYTETSGTVGSDSFTYTVTDDGGVSRTATVNITVTVDVPPAFTSTAATAVNEDAAYSYSIAASDADDDTATITAPTLPNWLTFTPAASGASTTATLTGNPTNAEVGDHSVTLTVSANGVDVDQSFTITVSNTNDAATFTSSPELSVTEGNTYTYTAAVDDVDPGPDTLTLSAPTLPSWLSFTPGTGVLTGEPATGDVGNHAVVIRVNDGTVNTDQSFTILVNSIGSPIAMTTLLGSTEGGVVGLESDPADSNGVRSFEYWSDNYDAAAATFTYGDHEYNHLTSLFDRENELPEIALNGSGAWVTESTIRVIVPDMGDGSMVLSVRDAADAELSNWRVSAQYVDITGDTLVSHLDAVWQSAMFDSSAVFTSGAKLITQYRFESLSDSYYLFNDDWCEDSDASRYAALNNNCNGINSSIDASGYATTLNQVVSTGAWFDPDDGSTPPNAIAFAWNDANNTTAMVELINGANSALFYVIDWDNADAAQRVSEPVIGSWVRDTNVQGVDMIRFTVPQSIASLFAEDLDGGLGHLLAVQNGFVRLGDYSIDNEVSYEQSAHLFNGLAKDQVLANFSGDNYTLAIEDTTRYSIYLNEDNRQFEIDVNTFSANGVFSSYDYQTGASSTETGTWDITSTGEMHITFTSGPDAGFEFWEKVKAVDPATGIKQICSSETLTTTRTGGVFNCVLMDIGFTSPAYSFEHNDETAAVNFINAANAPDGDIYPTLMLRNFDGSRPLVTGNPGAHFNAGDLTSGTHTLDTGDDVLGLVFNANGTGTIDYSDGGPIESIVWSIDVDGMLRFTETDGDGDQWFWVVGYFNTTVPGNVLVQVTTPVGQADSADYFVMGAFDQTLVQFADAATLAGTTKYNVYFDEDTEQWELESLEFDDDGSTYTLTTLPSGTPEVGTYGVTNGILNLVGYDYIQIISVDGSTGASRTCWESSVNNLSNCSELGYEFFFDDQTAAEDFQDNLTFTAGATVNATTLLAGGIYEFWDDEWDGTQQVPGYWTLKYDGSTTVDEDYIWSRALHKYVPESDVNGEVMLTSSGWQIGVDEVSDMVVSGNQATLNFRAPDDELVNSAVITFEAMDISGREIGLYAPDTMLDNVSASFSSGVQQIKQTLVVSMTYTELHIETGCNEYATWGNNCNIVWRRQMTGLDVETNLNPTTDLTFINAAGATIELAWHQNSGSNGTSLLGVFSGSSISYYTVDWGQGTTAVDTGVVGSFTLSTINGEQIIEYAVPNTIPNYDQFYLSYDVEDSETGILAVHNGYLRHGERQSSGSGEIWYSLNSMAANDVFTQQPAAPALSCGYNSEWHASLDRPVTFSSYTDFETIVTDCGGVATIDTAFVIGTWVTTEVYADGTVYVNTSVYNADGTGSYVDTEDGTQVDTNPFTWSVLNNRIVVNGPGYVDVAAVFTNGSAKWYSEDSGLDMSSDLTPDGTADGAIFSAIPIKQ